MRIAGGKLQLRHSLRSTTCRGEDDEDDDGDDENRLAAKDVTELCENDNDGCRKKCEYAAFEAL